MGSDAALLASVRTSMALITFGFIIFEYLQKISDKYLAGKLPAHSPRRFGFTLIILGIVLLCLEILNHAHYAHARGRRRRALFEQGLIRRPEMGRLNSAIIIALLLLIVGLLAILRVALSAGPF